MSQTKALLSRTSKEERGLKDEGKQGEEKPRCTSANLHVGQDPGLGLTLNQVMFYLAYTLITFSTSPLL